MTEVKPVYRWLKQVETEPTFRQYTEIIDIRHPPSAFCPHGLSAPKPLWFQNSSRTMSLTLGGLPACCQLTSWRNSRRQRRSSARQVGCGENLQLKKGNQPGLVVNSSQTCVKLLAAKCPRTEVDGTIFFFRVTWGQVTMLVCTPCSTEELQLFFGHRY